MGGRVQVHMPSTLRAREPFRLLFAGQALSVVGDRMMAVAIAFAVLAIGDATDLGIVLAASGMPFALFAIAGGVLSDRVGRRRDDDRLGRRPHDLSRRRSPRSC